VKRESSPPRPSAAICPPGGGEKYVISLDISDESSPEASELPSGGEEDAVFMAISGEPGPEAQGKKAQGTMVGGLPIGDDVSGQSSPAA
jgi:hypothetical protein